MCEEPPFCASRTTCLGHVSRATWACMLGLQGSAHLLLRNLGALGSASAGLKPEGFTGYPEIPAHTGTPQRASLSSPRVTVWTRVGAGGARSRENPMWLS